MTARCKRFFCLASLWLIASTAVACKLPVFRYALERWTVDRYRMVAIVDESEGDAVGRAVAELQLLAGSSANVDVEVIDLSTISELDLWQLEEFDGDAETPWLQVFFPERNGRRKKCWEGHLTATAVQSWSDSQLRRQIARDLVSGVSAVWLMVDGVDQAQNQRVADEVALALSKAGSEIAIPAGVIPRDGASRYLREHPDASMDDALRSDVPLKVEFCLRRLSRENRDEDGLRAMVSGFAGGVKDQPVLVPIFGRGRMLDAIVAENAEAQTIVNACRYMVGECSCTVKALNPGVDVILNVNWQEQLGQSVVVVDHSRFPESGALPTLVPVPTGHAVDIEVQPIAERTGSQLGIGLVLISFLVAAGYVARGFAVHRLR